MEAELKVETGDDRPAIVPPPLRCPKCGAEETEPTPRCHSCKLTLRRLDPKFGGVPHHSRLIADRAGAVRRAELEKLKGMLRLFQRRFPQTLFSVFIADLPQGTSIAEYTFWMSNRARFGTRDIFREENMNVLLLIEPTARRAALTVGYGLEHYITRDELADVLAAGEEFFRDDDFAAGIRACIDAMTRQLRRAAQRLSPSYEAEPQEWAPRAT